MSSFVSFSDISGLKSVIFRMVSVQKTKVSYQKCSIGWASTLFNVDFGGFFLIFADNVLLCWRSVNTGLFFNMIARVFFLFRKF